MATVTRKTFPRISSGRSTAIHRHLSQLELRAPSGGHRLKLALLRRDDDHVRLLTTLCFLFLILPPYLVPHRRASTSLIPPSTPTTAVAHLTISTPPPTPPSLLPIHARARALLRPNSDCTGDMPGRERERSVIRDFITISDDGDQITSLYISGSPGTGKTALVNALIQSLGSDLNETKLITVNCMALENVEALWERLSEEFQGPCKRKQSRRTAKGKGKETVEDILSGLGSKWYCSFLSLSRAVTYICYSLLVLDELDHIATTAQSLSAVFSLPACRSSALRVIGIANTHTLTSSTASFSSSVQTLHFPPYTPAQLQLIVQGATSSLVQCRIC